MRIPQAAFSSIRYYYFFTRFIKVSDKFPRTFFFHRYNRSRRHGKHHVFAIPAMSLTTSTVTRVLRTIQLPLPITPEAIHTVIRLYYNATPPATITTIRPPKGHKLLPTESNSSIPSVACSYSYLSSIKHNGYRINKLYNNRYYFVFQQHKY